MITHTSIGQKFGLWTVISLEFSRSKRRWLLCRCQCGTVKEVLKSNLRCGESHNCGCINRIKSGERFRKHGWSRTPVYRVWQQMRQRCENPNASFYHRYGGRGISYAPEWRDFLQFLADVGERPFEDAQLDRIDNDGNYEHGNVRWATSHDNRRNTRRTRLITYEGRTMPLVDWAKELGVLAKTLGCRLFVYDWPVERAFTEPVRPANRHKNRNA